MKVAIKTVRKFDWLWRILDRGNAMWTVLFLDIDGVLNTREALLSLNDPLPLDRECIERLERVVETTKCELVLSSSWRYMGRLAVLNQLNRWLGRSSRIISRALVDETPRSVGSNPTRGDEIQAWLDQHSNEVSKFVILDDDADMGNLLPHLIRTNPEFGLTEEIAEELIARLS